MGVGIDDLMRVTERYLGVDTASVAVVSNDASIDANAGLGLEVCRLG